MDTPHGGWGEAGFEALGEEECLDLLSLGTFGRVAVTIGGIPAVFPVNYHFADGAIHFRTGEGVKLAAATRNAVVAFQLDEIDPLYHAGWSVLAVGTAQELKESVDLAWATRLPKRISA
jgi:nitroimidazol reductase NimA-like FMN-containing flavoprotein (pyridoxamine 5'-phosphate oxidase superfamily)